MRRGILGGTFDPPHLAHLVAGEAAYRELDLDVVTYVPAGAPWQKEGLEVSAADHRWAMTVLATADADYFESDDREVNRPGWTYTADTLDTFPEDEELFLILGADAARGLPTWRRSKDITDRVSFAVMPRPGVEASDVEDAVGAPIAWLHTPLLEISGTDVRARARRGQSVRFLVPETVWVYFETHELYAEHVNE